VEFDKIIYLTDPTNGDILNERKAYLDSVVSLSIEQAE